MQEVLTYFDTIPTPVRTILLVSGILFFLILESGVPLFRFDYKKGKLINKKVFLNLHKVGNDPYLGPDGLKYSKKHKSLFVAQYGGGKVYRVGLNGKINKSYNIDFKYPTNISISHNVLYITAAKDANREPYEGKIFKVKIDF